MLLVHLELLQDQATAEEILGQHQQWPKKLSGVPYMLPSWQKWLPLMKLKATTDWLVLLSDAIRVVLLPVLWDRMRARALQHLSW